MSPHYRYTRHIAWQIVGGEVLVVDIASGGSIGLNRSASFIFANLEKSTADELVNDFAARFRIGAAEAAGHVTAFIDDLVRRNLIERAA